MNESLEVNEVARLIEKDERGAESSGQNAIAKLQREVWTVSKLEEDNPGFARQVHEALDDRTAAKIDLRTGNDGTEYLIISDAFKSRQDFINKDGQREHREFDSAGRITNRTTLGANGMKCTETFEYYSSETVERVVVEHPNGGKDWFNYTRDLATGNVLFSDKWLADGRRIVTRYNHGPDGRLESEDEMLSGSFAKRIHREYGPDGKVKSVTPSTLNANEFFPPIKGLQ